MLPGPPGSPGRPCQFPNPQPRGHEPQLRSPWDPAQSPGAWTACCAGAGGRGGKRRLQRHTARCVLAAKPPGKGTAIVCGEQRRILPQTKNRQTGLSAPSDGLCAEGTDEEPRDGQDSGRTSSASRDASCRVDCRPTCRRGEERSQAWRLDGPLFLLPGGQTRLPCPGLLRPWHRPSGALSATPADPSPGQPGVAPLTPQGAN